MVFSKHLKEKIFICYDSCESIKVVKKIFRKIKQKNFYQIEVEVLPNDIYIIKNDMTTYYNGYYKGECLITKKLIINNKKIY